MKGGDDYLHTYDFNEQRRIEQGQHILKGERQLRPEDIRFGDDVEEMAGHQLNFYIETWFKKIAVDTAKAGSCPLGQVPESVLHEAFLRLYHKLKWHGDEILAPMVKDLRRIRRRKLLWSEDVVALNKQISEISEQNQLLASMNQMGLVDPDLYIARSNEYGRQLREAKRKRAKLLDEDGGDDAIDKTEDLLDTLETTPDFLLRFDESVFGELVERMELTADHRLIFHLYNGLSLTECVDRRERP